MPDVLEKIKFGGRVKDICEVTEKLVKMSCRLELLDNGKEMVTFHLCQQHLGPVMEISQLEMSPWL